jgi:hypothetical protein
MKIIRLVNWLSLVFAATLVTVAFTFAYVLVSPLDVITDWTLRMDPGTYTPGQEVTLHGSYKKLRDVTGAAYYYLECKTPKGSLVRYPIVQTEGNRPKGSGEIDTPLQLPSIPTLPAQCRVAVSVDYTIYTFRKFTENNQSNYFEVKE